jgi:hypothetical protein
VPRLGVVVPPGCGVEAVRRFHGDGDFDHGSEAVVLGGEDPFRGGTDRGRPRPTATASRRRSNEGDGVRERREQHEDHENERHELLSIHIRF